MGCGASAPVRRDHWAPNAVHGNKAQGRPSSWAPPPPGYAPNQGNVQYVRWQPQGHTAPPPQWLHAGIAPPRGRPQVGPGQRPPYVPFPNFVAPRPPPGRKPLDHGEVSPGHLQPGQKIRPRPQKIRPRPRPPRKERYSPPRKERYSPPRKERYSPPRKERYSPPRKERDTPPRKERYSPPRKERDTPPRRDSPPRKERDSPPPSRPETPVVVEAPPERVHVKAATQEMTDVIRSCLKSGTPWDDPDFPAAPKTIDHRGKASNKIEWKRPQALVDNPRLLVHGVSTDDVRQGTLGDCWFLSSCAAIARESKLMAKVIPKDQYLWKGGGRYAGVAHFRFWRFGEWQDVYVDDNLPTVYGNLTYARCSDKNEFWLPLIEKAYAKLNGSYAALIQGHANDALTDLTGGICERFKTGRHEEEVLYKTLLKAQKRGSFMTCSTQSTFDEGSNEGLVSGHAYTITGVEKIRNSGKTHNLLRIRNPWGRQEWKGAWSDGSSEWQRMPENVRQRLGYENKDDGEFWMECGDFCEFYREVTIASLAEHEVVKTDVKSKWDVAQEIGEWEKGETAGGCRNHMKTYAKNPQYLFTLSSPDHFDPEEDDEEDRGTCDVLIGLHQELPKFKGKLEHIGFQVYEVSSPDRVVKLSKSQLWNAAPVFMTATYYNNREVTLRIQMEPGTYVIIPTTYQPNREGPFLLRVFTERPVQLRELGELE